MGAQTVLGALWIITALTHIGLGVLLWTTDNIKWWILWTSGSFPAWLGGLFLLFGVCCILSERYPKPIFILLSALINLAGFGLSLAAIIWYSNGMGDNRWLWSNCGNHDYRYRYHWNTVAPTTVSPVLLERCWEYIHVQYALTSSIYGLLITVSILNLFLALSSSIISIITLKQNKSQSGSQPLLKEPTAPPKEL